MNPARKLSVEKGAHEKLERLLPFRICLSAFDFPAELVFWPGALLRSFMRLNTFTIVICSCSQVQRRSASALHGINDGIVFFASEVTLQAAPLFSTKSPAKVYLLIACRKK